MVNNSEKQKVSALGKLRRQFSKEGELWVIAIIALVWAALFCFYPMYGIIYGFFDYYPGMTLAESDFVGFKFLFDFIKLPDFPSIMRNTLVVSLLNMTVGFVAPIILALLFNELHNRFFKRVIQTISYLPYFVSWVVVASLLMSMLGNDGILNNLLLRQGIIDKPIGFLTDGEKFWGLLVGSNIWKSIGYGSIIYISAIAGIDQEIYQAGAVDGLGRWGMVRHITIPSIMPTVILLFILGLGNILSAGFEQQLLLASPTTKEYAEVIDTYVYRYGIQLGNYSLATMVGFVKSIIGIVIVVMANLILKKTTKSSIF